MLNVTQCEKYSETAVGHAGPLVLGQVNRITGHWYFVVVLWWLCSRLNARIGDGINSVFSVYWTVHHLNIWIKRDQLDVTCFFISLFNAQHVSDVNTSNLRRLRLICWVISWVVLLWFDVCWCYVVVWLGWYGIL